MYQYEAKVKKVMGDSMISATIDLGFNKAENIILRLHGIRLNGERAETKLGEYITGRKVMIQTIKNNLKKSNLDPTYTGVIYLSDDPHSINDRMVNQGYANRVLE